MKFEPQCKTRADLHREMARVLDMCEVAGFGRPWECVKVLPGNGIGKWLVCEERAVGLDFSIDLPPEHREFAIAIVEGKPVFRDSEMYRSDNGWLCRWSDFGDDWQDEVGNWYNRSSFSLTWNPPQRTIEINGVKVKAADEVETTGAKLGNGERRECLILQFAYESDAEAFKAAMEGK